MRMTITFALLVAVACAALPAQAGDDDQQTILALREQVQDLQTKNDILEKTVTLSQQHARQMEETCRLSASLLDAARDMNTELQKKVRLLEATQAAAVHNEQLRNQWLTLQLENAQKELAGHEEETLTYYGSLLASLGTPAAQVVAARLQTDPKAHAPRLAPLLGRLGHDARGTLRVLDRIAADEAHKGSGAAGYARAAAAAIRKAAPAPR